MLGKIFEISRKSRWTFFKFTIYKNLDKISHIFATSLISMQLINLILANLRWKLVWQIDNFFEIGVHGQFYTKPLKSLLPRNISWQTLWLISISCVFSRSQLFKLSAASRTISAKLSAKLKEWIFSDEYRRIN